jgi:hypothetical protein
MYKLDELGVFIIPYYVQRMLCGGKNPQLTNRIRGGQEEHSAFLLVLVIFDIPRKIFKRLSTNLQKSGKLYYVTVLYAFIWVFKVPLSR